MEKSFKSRRYLSFLFFLLLGFASCVPQKEVLFLQNMPSTIDSTGKAINYMNERAVNYTIQPGDNLFIRVVSMDDKSSMVFNNENASRSNSYTDASIYLTSYTVNEEGQIDFPLVGKIVVKNLTVEQVKDKLQSILSDYMKETVVMVKLTNFNLTVIGEVSRPGQYKVYQSEINLFEAVAMAGNMTDFAKRDDVKIIRQTKTGSEVVTVNMKEADVLSSEYYYLKPNDIIYVEPLKIKRWGFSTFPYSTMISIITLGLTVATLMFNVKK